MVKVLDATAVVIFIVSAIATVPVVLIADVAIFCVIGFQFVAVVTPTLLLPPKELINVPAAPIVLIVINPSINPPKVAAVEIGVIINEATEPPATVKLHVIVGVAAAVCTN
jgi:hypothetical protein